MKHRFLKRPYGYATRDWELSWAWMLDLRWLRIYGSKLRKDRLPRFSIAFGS